MTVVEWIHEQAEERNLNPGHIRLWNWISRRNKTVRLQRPLKDDELCKPLQAIDTGFFSPFFLFFSHIMLFFILLFSYLVVIVQVEPVAYYCLWRSLMLKKLHFLADFLPSSSNILTLRTKFCDILGTNSSSEATSWKTLFQFQEVCRVPRQHGGQNVRGA